MNTQNPEEPGFEHEVDELPADRGSSPHTLEDDPLPEDEPDSADDAALVHVQADAAKQRTEGGYQ